MFSVCSPELHWNHIQQSHLGGKRDGQITAQIAEIEIDIIVHHPIVSNMHNCTAAVLPRPSHVWEEDCGHVDGAALHLVAVGITVSAVGTPSVCTGICVN